MTRSLRGMRFWQVVIAAVALAAMAPPATAAPSAEVRCTEVSIPVTLDPSGENAAHIAGTYCRPADPSPVLQILVPGATYDRTYWDFPGFGGRYSYVRHAAGTGLATLAIDPIGVGKSSKPIGLQVSALSAAQAVHEVIRATRAGALGRTWNKVVLVGHSFGSLTSMLEAGTYRDVDGLLISGASHAPGPGGIATIIGAVRPALNDPATAGQVPAGDLGYLSVPGARRAAFYAPADSDPRVVAADEASRTAGTVGILATIPVFIPATFDIAVPVLIANGTADKVFCEQGGGGSLTDCSTAATLYGSERPFFPRAKLETYALPGAGHSMNLALNGTEFFDRANEWVHHVAES
ncbi:alpha/beta hydrolase [Nocardia miyunensis]|uniref:alpha/beta hydrolase n=1 Tax=Nocardia miyunensis TaxID=282684 RepID=UPI000A00DC6E|nr:alpha/beta fold hydrolase [Nocardia miyunensis]